MADLLTRPLLRRDEPAWGSRVPWLAAVLAAGWSLVAGLALSVLPGVAVWIGEGALAPVGDPLRFGARVWLVAHRVGLDIGGADLAFAPLGLTAAAVLLLYRSARWAAHSAGVSTERGLLAVVGPAVLTYVLGAGLLAALSATPDVSAAPLGAVLWAGVWSGCAVTAGVAHESGLLATWFARVPPLVRVSLTGGGVALAGLLAVGALLTVVSLITRYGRVGELARALDAGALGSAVLVLGCAVIVPNAVIWAAAFALGPGFAMGAGTSVAPDGVTLGLVPAVPLFGALPASVPGPLTWLVLLGPLLAGVAAGLMVHRRLAGLAPPDEPADSGAVGVPLPLWHAVGVAGGAGAVAGVGMAVLALLSGGSAGAARLTELGPVPWEVTAAALVLVGVPSAATALVLRLRPATPQPDPVDPEAAAVKQEADSGEPEARAVEAKADAVKQQADPVEPEADAVEPEAAPAEDAAGDEAPAATTPPTPPPAQS